MNAELKKLIKNLGELAALAENLESVKSIEQAEAEAKSRIAAMQRESEQIKNEACGVLAKAKIDATEMISKATIKSATIGTEADSLLETTKEQCRALVTNAEKAADKALMGATEQLAAMESAAKKATQAKDDAAAELADIEAKIAKARKAVASLVE